MRKFSLVMNPRWSPVLKIAKPVKSTAGYNWPKFCMDHLWEAGVQKYQNEKISIT